MASSTSPTPSAHPYGHRQGQGEGDPGLDAIQGRAGAVPEAVDNSSWAFFWTHVAEGVEHGRCGWLL
eukprot:6482825-Pyramimonas_sp.AAC.1